MTITVSRTTVSVEDFEKDSVEAPALDPAALPAEQRKQTTLAVESAQALLLKGLLHRHAPADFPVSEDKNSLEARVAKVVADLDDKSFAVLRPKIRSVAADRSQIPTIVGKNLDLTRPILDADLTGRFPERPIVKVPKPPKRPKYNRVFLSLRKLHCVDETNPEGGADDMVMGGILTHPDGTASAIKSFVAGSFDDGDCQDYGILQLGSSSLAVTPGYPKNVYATFLLIESDSDDEEVAAAVASICKLVAALATALGQPIVAAAAAFVGGVVDVFAALFIGENRFPPYGIELRLANEDQFGAGGTQNGHTGNIRGHDGAYRIGFRWALVA